MLLFFSEFFGKDVDLVGEGLDLLFEGVIVVADHGVDEDGVDERQPYDTACDEDDDEINALTAFLNDAETVDCMKAERAFLAAVDGGCQVPVGVYAETKGNELSVEAVIASLDGSRVFREKIKGSRNEAGTLGKALARTLLEQGALAILQEMGLLLLGEK